MPKVSRPRIAGPVRDDDEDDRPARSSVRAKDIPYSVAWFREKVATYAFGTVVCGAVMVTAAAWMGGSLGKFGQRLGNGFNVLSQHAGLAVTHVEAPGLDPALTEKVLKVADVKLGENMFGADPHRIRDKVETIEAIGSVKVFRLWPNQISIIADPREPVALWRENGEWRVIDQKGRSFANVNPKDFMHLPRVEGSHAAEAAPGLLATISEFPNLRDRFETATRINGRRWNVTFEGGIEAVLPDDARMKGAFAEINLINAQHRLLDLPVARIDARHPERLAMAPIAGAPSADPHTALPGGA